MRNTKKTWAVIVTTVLGIAVVIASVMTFRSANDAKVPAATASPDTPVASVYTPPADNRIKLEIYGDSITQGDTPYGDTPAGAWSPGSWPMYLGREFLYIGGFTRGGMTTGSLIKEDNLQYAIHGRADYLVLQLGTNDTVLPTRDHDKFWANITEIAQKQDYSPDKVVIILLGPEEREAVARTYKGWNEATITKAKQSGYHVIDPWAAELATPERSWSKPN